MTRSSRFAWGAMTAAWAIYVLAFVATHRLFEGRFMLVAGPLVATAWMFGLRGGIAAGLAALPFNWLLQHFVAGADVTTLIQERGVIGLLVTLLIGGTVGRLRDLGDSLRSESEERLIVEERSEALRLRLQDQVLAARDEERRQIARHLHDESGQILTAMVVGLRALEDTEQDPARADHLRQLRGHGQDTIESLRSLAHALHPSMLDDLGLGPAIERLASVFGRRHGLTVDVQVRGLDGPDDLSPKTRIALYRVVQEALTNVARHADARSASVVVERNSDGLKAMIEDDGRGLGDAPLSVGLGLTAIRERIGALGGEVTLESPEGAGTTLYVTVPTQLH